MPLAPISTELDLTYQNGFQINFTNVTLIAGEGLNDGVLTSMRYSLD